MQRVAPAKFEAWRLRWVEGLDSGSRVQGANAISNLTWASWASWGKDEEGWRSRGTLAGRASDFPSSSFTTLVPLMPLASLWLNLCPDQAKAGKQQRRAIRCLHLLWRKVECRRKMAGRVPMSYVGFGTCRHELTTVVSHSGASPQADFSLLVH